MKIFFSLLRVLTVVIVFTVQGCGSGDGDLIGSLDMTATKVDDSGGYSHAESTVTYKHPTKDPTGTEISYSENIYTPTIRISSFSQTKKVNSSGAITFISKSVQQGTEPIFIDVSAQTGSLTQFKRITIPAIASLSATPTAVAFLVTDAVGTAKTVAISGGISPYSASSSTPNIGVSATGASVSITNNVLITGLRTATITITDSAGKSVNVSVGY
ncbi:hypothetical protein [Geobacter argillaceus]|uniref:Uncharacterized protein n=1 Tax=Geobacter argillaceus TaxID=345631 RepID=A0A562WRK6_9BACT|nr:hypothetical protein [Geobacter argillaceus]TWJ32776.1 hypothetical protein JN12_00753 [Geobacter argillaceus]